MTLIEFYSDCHVDNLGACLQLRPEKLVLFGCADQMKSAVECYRQLLAARGQETCIRLIDVTDGDFQTLCHRLVRLVEVETHCVIDLTGGGTAAAMAMGVVYGELEPKARQQMRVIMCDYPRGCIRDCMDPDGSDTPMTVQLTATELIALHGGRVLSMGGVSDTEEPVQMQENLWQLVCGRPKDWNKELMILNEFEGHSLHKMNICLELSQLESAISGFQNKLDTLLPLLQKLRAAGVIEDLRIGSTISYRYRSPMLRYCTRKAGNLLELKTLSEGRAFQMGGKAYFQDCCTGVYIDWDGITHHPLDEEAETRNEIDVVLMHGMIPLFISCKNGKVDENELFKLSTVAERFGGKYAKKMLVATALELGSPGANRSFIQRAWDMDIFLVTDAALLEQLDWQQCFYQAIR